MLSSEYIHEKMLNTSSSSSEDVSKLAELIDLYPYVSSFPILYLKALANSKDVRLESEIEKYAYKISSRSILFELLNPNLIEQLVDGGQVLEIIEESTAPIVIETPIIEPETITLETIIKLEPIIIESVPSNSIETLITEPKPQVIPSKIEQEIEFDEQETETILEIKSHLIESPDSKLEEISIPNKFPVNAEKNPSQIEITEAIESLAIEIIPEKEILPTEISETISEIITESEEIIQEIKSESENNEILIEIELLEIESKNEELRKEDAQLEQLIQSSAISTNFLISNFKEELVEKPTKTQEIEIPVEKNNKENLKIEITEKEDLNKRSFSSWLNFNVIIESAKSEIKEESPALEIEQQPKKVEYYSFNKPKKEFYSPVKKAKESLNENNMPVSETLAKIFALQGNYPKSIYVYEQLILIFPEKKSSFATQIKNLKKKLNS